MAPSTHFLSSLIVSGLIVSIDSEKAVPPSTPKNGKHSRSVDFDLSPPPAPKKIRHRARIPTNAIFCCNNVDQIMVDNDVFAEFKQGAAKGISMAENWALIVAHSIDHLIEVVPSLQLHLPRLEARYFVCMSSTNKYREVSRDGFEYFKESKRVDLVISSWYNCEEHRHGYNLSKFERTEIEGVGLKKAELSPQQFSREKRQIMVRKFSQGRQGEIEEFERKLKNAKEEDLDEVSKRVTFGRKEEVNEVARRLSSSKISKGEDVDLHLARINMYYSES